MEEVIIKNREEVESSCQFEVSVGDLEYSVTVDKDYWQELTDGTVSREDLVKNSFEFLLEREPKESILRQFNLRQIQNYFPEYETEIRGNKF